MSSMMPYAMMPQQNPGGSSEGQQGMSLQNLQNMTMNQLGQIGMSTHQVPFSGGIPMALNPTMMQGMTLPSMNFGSGQRGAPQPDKKKTDEKK